ncbi:MAG: DUF4492 domain-containing protein [Alistipes sp.]|nr:DUF4492 domain-containing protein [Alistipes sp.]MDE6779649.1 DUF4492 domain-containing protein [Alistipes sp.]
MESERANILLRAAKFYVDGFRSMTLGRTLWAVILIKLFIMFAVLRVFFFRDPMASKSARERADAVLENFAAAETPGVRTEYINDNL